jgi:hypothetical protein
MENIYSSFSKKYLLFFIVIATIYCKRADGQILWTAPPVNSAWLTTTNWQFGAVPNTTDWVRFDVNTPGAGGIGINMGDPATNNGANNQAVGAIEVTAARTTNLLIGNSSTGSNGTLTLNGATVNGIANVILGNASPNLFTIDNSQALGNKILTVALNNTIDNIINIDAAGGIAINTEISGVGNLTLSGNGTGTLSLTAANTYTGLTTVSSTTLQLNKAGGGTLPTTNNVIIGTVGTLKVSSNQTLNDVTLSTGGNLILDPGVVLTINGTFFHNGGTISGTGIITYGAGATLAYGALIAQTTNDFEFPTISGPANLSIGNTAGVTLHALRTISGTLNLINGNLIIGNNNITVSSITGGSVTSYVVTNGTGKLTRKNISTSVLLPIGATITSYTPLTIGNGTNVGSIDYSVKVDVGFTASLIADPDLAVSRTWFVSASATPAGSIAISFYYFGTFATDAGTLFSPIATTDHGIFLPLGYGWNINQTGLTQTPAAGMFVTNTLVSSFLGTFDFPMVIGNLGAVLAIKRSIDLSAQKQNGKGLLSWIVNSSTPVKETVIEKSADGKKFIHLSTVGANAKSYTDNNLLTGTNYYRIKITDINGKIIYSSKVAILNKENGFDIISLMPNIVNTDMALNITSAQKTKMNVVIADVTGKAVTKNVYSLIAGSNQFDINVANLSAGMYFVTAVTVNGDSKTIRFVKQ